MATPVMRRELQPTTMPVHGGTQHVIHSSNGSQQPQHIPEPQQLSPPQPQGRTYCNPQWGLLGLVNDPSSFSGYSGDIATEDQIAFRQQLRRGFDLTTLGIDVVQEIVVKPYTIFSAPCDDSYSWTTPEVAPLLPECYKATPPPLDKNFSNFTPDTLLYIFYAVVSEQYQARAALELYSRHKMFYLRRALSWARDNEGALEIFNPKIWQFVKVDQAITREDLVPISEMEDLCKKLQPTPPADAAPAQQQQQQMAAH